MAGRGGANPRSNAGVVDVRLRIVAKEVRPTFDQGAAILRMLCDSDPALFRVPRDKMPTLHHLQITVLAVEKISFRALERIAGKCMSMTVAIRPASRWTHVMFTTLSKLAESGLRRIDLWKAEIGHLQGEFRQ